MKLAALVTLLVAAPAGAAAQTQAAQEPIVQVGIYGYGPDGSIAVAAYDTWPDLTSTVYIHGCGMGAGNRQPPAGATDVWQFTGKVLSSTSEQAVIQLVWRRPIVRGRPVDGNQSSTQLTLRAGEVVQLDQAGIDEKPNCPAKAVAFEARYTPRFSGMGFPAGGVGSGGSGVSGGTGVVSGKVTSTMRPAGAGGFGTSVSISQAGGDSAASPATGAGLFDVNLWLVRAVPGRPDEVTHFPLLRMNQTGASFAFTPVAVTTSRGEAMVQVTGSLAVVRGTSGENQLVFSTSRRVSPSATGQAPRDGSLDSQGMSRIVNRMPGPEEALSFEFPPLKINGELVAPDQFAVRLKIAPR